VLRTEAGAVVKTSSTFIDETQVIITSGDGGDGMVSFRREKFVPFGGPNGGDGGWGGDVVLVADRNINTLSDLHHRQRIKAEHGEKGGTKDKTGARGEATRIRLPMGTVVYDAEADADCPPLVDLSKDAECYVAAKGGKGGLGNARFKNSHRQTPNFALPGLPGETVHLRFSLKLLADVGLVGFPNAGKSTLLRRLSKAKPKVASYPFTTLTPSLGVVERGDSRFVVADIPGLIEGASTGAGLGHQFLRHVERTRVLVHLLDLAAMLVEERDLISDYHAIRRELERYQPALLDRHEIVVLNKADVISDPEMLKPVQDALSGIGVEYLLVSGATGQGVDELVRRMQTSVDAAVTAERQAEAAIRA
jgi:GTP-binding protein